MDLNQMAVFVRVVQAGSFSAAARQLGMPKSTLSRKVSELEERLGSRLLQRTTRKLGLTDAGRIYFDHAARIVAEVQIAEDAVATLQASPRGLLRVTAPLSFVVLPPIITAFAKKYPEVQLDIVCSDRRVDLVDENFDVGIRTGTLSDSSLVARTLGTFKRVVVAAPHYCKENGTPKSPADLEKHVCITFGAGISPNTWVLGAGDERVEIRVTPRLTANDFDILRTAALDGLGIAFLPEFACAEDVRKKRLLHVLPDWCSAETSVSAVYPTARHLSPKVSAFIDILRAQVDLRI